MQSLEFESLLFTETEFRENEIIYYRLPDDFFSIGFISQDQRNVESSCIVTDLINGEENSICISRIHKFIALSKYFINKSSEPKIHEIVELTLKLFVFNEILSTLKADGTIRNNFVFARLIGEYEVSQYIQLVGRTESKLYGRRLVQKISENFLPVILFKRSVQSLQHSFPRNTTFYIGDPVLFVHGRMLALGLIITNEGGRRYIQVMELITKIRFNIFYKHVGKIEWINLLAPLLMILPVNLEKFRVIANTMEANYVDRNNFKIPLFQDEFSIMIGSHSSITNVEWSSVKWVEKSYCKMITQGLGDVHLNGCHQKPQETENVDEVIEGLDQINISEIPPPPEFADEEIASHFSPLHESEVIPSVIAECSYQLPTTTLSDSEVYDVSTDIHGEESIEQRDRMDDEALNSKLWKCNLCFVRTTHGKRERSHKLSKHKELFIFHCQFCGYLFSSGSSKRRHERECVFRRKLIRDPTCSSYLKLWTTKANDKREAEFIRKNHDESFVNRFLMKEFNVRKVKKYIPVVKTKMTDPDYIRFQEESRKRKRCLSSSTSSDE